MRGDPRYLRLLQRSDRGDRGAATAREEQSAACEDGAGAGVSSEPPNGERHLPSPGGDAAEPGVAAN